MALTITITTAGRAAIVNANNTGTDPVTITQIGLSETAHVPAPANTVLPGEIKRINAISGLVVADDTIHVSMSDTSADAYNLRSLALYLADGTLFAIYGQADPILVKVAASIAALSVDVTFADIDAADLTFGDASFVNPPASETVQGVVQLATLSQAQAGVNDARALSPLRAKAAVLAWLLEQDGAGTGLDADLLDGLQATAFARSARTLTGGGLVTGGGDLTANRILTVTAASQAEAAAGVIGDKAVTPSSLGPLIANIANNAAEISIEADARLAGDSAIASRTITGGGLVTGGGNLGANRVLTVTAASAAEALAGAASDKALTPASLTSILALLAGKVGLDAVTFGSNTISLRIVLDPSNTLLIQGGTGFMSQNSSGFITFPLAYSVAPLCIVDGGPTDFGEGDVHGTALATTTGKAIVNGGNDPGHYSWLAIGKA